MQPKSLKYLQCLAAQLNIYFDILTDQTALPNLSAERIYELERLAEYHKTKIDALLEMKPAKFAALPTAVQDAFFR